MTSKGKRTAPASFLSREKASQTSRSATHTPLSLDNQTALYLSISTSQRQQQRPTRPTTSFHKRDLHSQASAPRDQPTPTRACQSKLNFSNRSTSLVGPKYPVRHQPSDPRLHTTPRSLHVVSRGPTTATQTQRSTSVRAHRLSRTEPNQATNTNAPPWRSSATRSKTSKTLSGA
jgi:hypothetical protein